jgi:hypothetical protein
MKEVQKMYNIYTEKIYYFFMSKHSFKQNIMIRKELRNYVNWIIYKNINNLIEHYKYIPTVTCIGGESYIYGMFNNFYNMNHYTNSKYIYSDLLENNNLYKKKIDNYLIDYSTYKDIKNADILILNLAKLNLNLLKQCNNRFYKYIIIINCHHIEFWNRIKHLNNYKLISRKQFIVTNYFVTVSVLQYTKNIPIYISLGNTCAIAKQLQNTGLRNISFPFDWCKLGIKQVNKVLNNNFTNYSNLQVVKFSTNHRYIHSTNVNSGSYLLKNSYNILFAHELYKISTSMISGSSDIDKMSNKIINRIDNFDIYKNHYLRFVIHSSTIEYKQINLLINNLKTKFTNFIILYITNKENNTYLYNHPNQNSIKIITIDYNIIDWKDWTLSSINWFDLLFSSI